ncbi:Ig-like domain repeat protein [Occallatibacter savannae]|uniref:Ig-like domain repeat protein n=1 Tax=Occallatibacter savannae TaxID=1002691 RepID=UPI0013A57577|nr:Ig-like domain repeat protein [Occallatibacter savannae]
MQLLGANAGSSVAGLAPLPGRVNYFIGNDPAKWRTGIATYGKVQYKDAYPDIDLIFYGNQRQLEYDFVVKPGGDSSQIAWSFRGAEPRLVKDGSLELETSGRPVQFLAPVAYQIVDGERRPVAVSYAVTAREVHFALGAYDRTKTLVIDPVLSYFSYLGGTGNDYIGNSVNQGYGSPSPEPTQAVGVDGQSNLYVAGSTSSLDFPTASPALSKTTKGSGQYWAFVSKFSPDGSKLLYSTYIGGSAGGNDIAWALAVDSTGNAYVTGAAGTNDFPVTAGAFQTVCGPAYNNFTNGEVASCTFNTGSGNYTQNAFALKLNPTGSTLIYSSFLGGQGASWGTGIAVDSAGQAYVTGVASANGCGGPAYLYGAQYGCFPTTSDALISDIGGGNPIDMAFMSVFNATGSSLVYSTLFGDKNGTVSVKGGGCSIDCGAGTYGTSIALDSAGNVYIGGRTVAANMITTPGAYNTLGSGPIPATPQILVAPSGYGYVAKFAPVTASGSTLVYSTYFGGGAVYGGDVGGLAADSSGNVYITGETHAADFPATAGAYQTTCDPTQVPTYCNQTGYVAKLNPSGTGLVWATFFGVGSNAPLYFLAPVVLDPSNNVYVLGEGTGQLPLGGGNLSTLTGNNTLYVAKFNPTGSQVLFGSTFGGPGNAPEKAGGLAVDAAGGIYVGGAIGAGGQFSTTGAFQQAYAGGGTDAFVAKVMSLQPSTTALTTSPASPTVGQQVTLNAKVSGPQGATVVPTGKISFLSGSTSLGTGTLDNTGTATFSTSSLAANTYSLTASYGGDGNYSPSASSAQMLVVSPYSTTTTLTVSPTTASVGQTIAFTAKVKASSGSAVPTGTITFLNGTKQLAAVAVDSSGSATYTSSTLAAGSYSITAAYSGDANDASSTSSAATLVISVPAVGTTTSLAASASTVVSGANITFTATVSPVSGAVVPTGTVTFKDGSTSLGTGTLDATGKATYSTKALSVGTHSTTAAYGGDAGNLTSTSSALSIVVNAPPAPDFTLSIAPASTSVNAGTAATATVTVTPVNGFTGATTFACSNLPANSTCNFSPASVTPNGTAASTTTMTIESNVKAAIAFAGGSLSLLLIPIVATRDRRRIGLLVGSLSVLLLTLATVAMSACGGTAGGGTKTPAGTYTVTVTATSGSLTHSSTYSLTVK